MFKFDTAKLHIIFETTKFLTLKDVNIRNIYYVIELLSLNQMKLVIDKGHWATKDNDMIFGNVVWLTDEKSVLLYHLIDDNRNEIELPKPITDYIVLESIDLER